MKNSKEDEVVDIIRYGPDYMAMEGNLGFKYKENLLEVINMMIRA